eukprot:Nk52_evm5s164 gene=Nk52_evmTU5s164
MGASASILSDEEISEVQNISGFKPEEIKRLYRRFKQLDKANTGTISTDDFLAIPELAMNPLVTRVIAIFDEQHNDSVNFKQFVTALSVFRVDGSVKDKQRFAFKVYDIDGDGFISSGELFEVLKMMVGVNIGNDQLEQIVEKTIAEADKDKDGKLCYEEFVEVLQLVDIDSKMSIRF